MWTTLTHPYGKLFVNAPKKLPANIMKHVCYGLEVRCLLGLHCYFKVVNKQRESLPALDFELGLRFVAFQITSLSGYAAIAPRGCECVLWDPREVRLPRITIIKLYTNERKRSKVRLIFTRGTQCSCSSAEPQKISDSSGAVQ